jgi:hypothetical protein
MKEKNLTPPLSPAKVLAGLTASASPPGMTHRAASAARTSSRACGGMEASSS